MTPALSLRILVSTALFVISVRQTGASLITLPSAEALGTGSSLITFDGLASGTEVNSLTVGGVTFQVALLGTSTDGQVQIDGGPGITDNVNPPNIVSFGNPAGLKLTVTLPTLSSHFGYGYAVLAFDTIPDATTVELFSGMTSLGSLSYTATADPLFSGGFAGVESTIPFNRAELIFSEAGAAFAVDNIRFLPVTSVSERGSSLAILGVALVALHAFRWLNSLAPAFCRGR